MRRAARDPIQLRCCCRFLSCPINVSLLTTHFADAWGSRRSPGPGLRVTRSGAAIGASREKADNGTRALLEEILHEEEERIDYLEAQLGIIEEIGKELYLAELM